jgi:hypothetical protein
MSNALLRPKLARVVIRTSAAVDNLKGMTEQATLPLVKAEWLANQTTANRDFVAAAGRNMGGISYGPGIGNTWGYTVQPSENDGNFWVYLRHELAHNMNVGHADGGGPEGETINGRNNNGYARLSTSELEVMLNYRDSVIAQYDNEGTFTTINIPPYACLDSAVIQRPGTTQATLNVMANDHDANGHAITGIVAFDAISNKGGTVTQTGSGATTQLVYTPRSDYAGLDWFYYTVSDSSGQTATGLVTIDVNPPDTSFVGWWRLDETSGPDYRDSSPMGTLVTSENVSSGVAGKFGKAANLSTSSSQVPIVRTTLGSASSTITAWIKRPSTLTQASFAGIVFNRGSSAAGLHFGNANELRYTWNNNFFNWNSGLIPPADQWVLVALVVEPTKATIYMHDGTTLSSAVNTGTHNPDMTSGFIHLGRDTTSSSRRFVGNMDDVRLFRRALTQAELLRLVNGGSAETPTPFDTATGVADTFLTWQPDPQATQHQIYIGTSSSAVASANTSSPEYQGITPLAIWNYSANTNTTYYWRIDSINTNAIVAGKVWSFTTGAALTPPNPSSGLLAHWKLDETSGTLAASTTGTYPGTVVGSPLRTAGADGNAISFDGINDGVTTGVPLLSNRTFFTIAGWYRSPLTTGNRVALWGQNDVVEFGISGPNLFVFTPSGGSLSVPLPTPNEWHHVTCVGDGASLKIYINGLLAASGGNYVSTVYGSSTVSGFNIGTATWDTSGNWFTGQIDEVRLYDRALNDIEVYALGGTPVTNQPPVFTTDPITRPTSTAGNPYTGTLSGSATDSIGEMITYTKTSGPTWLSVAHDGSLSGTPTASDVGLNTFNIRATDGGGLFDSAVLNITIVPVSTTITVDSPAADTVRIPGLVGLVIETTISDNGTGQAPILTWSQISGPGTVTFGDASAADTTATFSTIGTYVLRLDVDDGFNHFTRDLTVIAGASNPTWNPTYSNIGSVTNNTNSSTGNTYTMAGRSGGLDSGGTSDSFQTYAQSFSGDFDLISQVSGTDLANTTTERLGLIARADASSAGAVSAYVGFNTTGSTFTASWITRATTNAANSVSNVTTSFTGTRWVRLNRVGNLLTGSYGSDGSTWTQAGTFTMNGTIRGGLCWSPDRTGSTGTGTFSNVALVNPNIAPATNTGSDQVITLPSSAALTGTALDDGLPIPTAVTVLWQKLSGPGSVSFTAPTSTTTSAEFSTDGSYQLRLIADDGHVKTFDDISILVNPIPQHALTVVAVPSQGGSVTGSGIYLQGSSQPITAAPASGWHFVNWTGSGIANPALPSTTVTVDAEKTVTANFAINTYTLSYSAGPNGSLTGDASQIVDHGSNGTSVTAVPATGYHFVNWSDNSTDNPRTDSNVTANLSVTASFAINTYTLSYTAGPNGSLTGDASQTVDHGSNGSTVTAVPATGYHFVNWSDNSTENPRTDTNVTATLSVIANFAINTYTLSYSAGPNGSLTGNTVQTVDHGSNGSPVSAVPATGYHFVNWSDNSTDNPRADTNVTANLSVTANFAINTYTLSYTAGPNGSLTGNTSQTVDHGSNGSPVTAVPATGYHFVNWSDNSTDNPRTDSNITANLSVTANFAINTYTLSYSSGPNGSLTGDASQTIDHGSNGSPVTAVPATGYHFVNWSDNSTDNPRTDSNVTANLSVTANFAINTYTLSYSAGPNGSLTGDASQTIDHGSTGSPVTAVPASGYHFVNWSDNGTDNPRTDSNITANLSVTANFELSNPDANSNGILDTWETLMFGNADPGNHPPAADPDGDGISNLLEYAFNTHPLQPNPSPMVHDFVAAGQGNHLRLTLPKNPSATNLAYIIEVTGDLTNGPWTSIGTTLEADTATVLRVRDDTGTTSATTRFMRLRVIAN